MTINNIDEYWRNASNELKVFVKYQILMNGYIEDTGELLRGHVWECLAVDLSLDCCSALISHYRAK